VSTSWLLTKMSIRHLSYISTDLFWTKIATTNRRATFLPLGAPFLLWDLPSYTQTHRVFPIQKACGSVTKKGLLIFPISPQATNCLRRSGQRAHSWSTTVPAAPSFILRPSQHIRQLDKMPPSGWSQRAPEPKGALKRPLPTRNISFRVSWSQ
jgi:hypothetical protein